MTSPALPQPRRARGLSLEQKLPLWISTLLLLTLVGASWTAYRQVKRATLATAAEHLRVVSRQLADMSRASAVTRSKRVRAVAADSAVRAALRSPGPERARAAAAALQRLATPTESTIVAELWDVEGRRRVSSGVPLTERDLAQPRAIVRAAGQAGGQGDAARTSTIAAGGGSSQDGDSTVIVGHLSTSGDSAFTWTVAPVRDGATLLGHLVQRRRLGSPPQTERQIRQLTGEAITVFVAEAGAKPWVSLVGGTPVAAPVGARETAPGIQRYERAGERRIAARAGVSGTPWSVILEVPLAAVLERPRAVLRGLLVAAALISVVGAAAAWAISRTVTRPLATLTRAAGAIAAGDYGRRVDAARGDELGRLGEAFNVMADRVAESRASLERQRAAAEAARSAAEAARFDAVAANQAKSDFLAVMSHEIRTPINAMIGYAQLIELGISGPVTSVQQEQLERVRKSGNHLLSLVNEVLDLAKVESGELHVLAEHAVAADAADAALMLTRPQAVAKGIRLTERCAGARDAAYVGDEQRVRQIVVNLLSNAVKFSNPGGRVSVICSVVDRPAEGAALAGAGPWACLRVEDNGIGIVPEQLAAMFEPFVQAERGLTRSQGGTGLGLSVSRRLARLMGGDVTARSQLGEGSCFTLWLPAAPELQDAPARGVEDARRWTPPAGAALGNGRDAAGLAELGERLLDRSREIVRAFVGRLRADPLVPQARSLSDVQLEDHVATFLANVAQSLIVLGHAGEEPVDPMRDSSEIQRVIAERHGAQRHRLGWSEEGVAREFALLREEVERALALAASPGSPATHEAQEVLARFVEQSARLSVRGLQAAERAPSA